MIYLLTAVWLILNGSTTVHIYTQTVHRTTQLRQNIQKRTYIYISVSERRSTLSDT